MKGLLCKIHKRLMDKMTVKFPPLSSSSLLFLLGLLTPVAFCFFYTSPVNATTVNANPSYVWATYRNLEDSSDSYINHEMCNSQQTCSNPFALLGNNMYDVYGLVVDTPLNFTTLSYGSAKYTMYIWSGGSNLGGLPPQYASVEEYSTVYSATISGTLRDGSAVSVDGVCSRTWQDIHQIKLECYYQNLPANTTFNITTVRFGHSSLSTENHPIFSNRPSLNGGVTYISNYEFTYSTSNSAESGYLQEITNQNTTIINQNQQIINNQQATTDAIQEQNDRDEQDREDLQNQSQDIQDQAEQSSAQSEQQLESIFATISNFFIAVSNAQPTNCVIPFSIPVHNTVFQDPNNLNIDICSLSIPSVFNIIATVVVLAFSVSISIIVVNAALSLYSEILGKVK